MLGNWVEVSTMDRTDRVSERAAVCPLGRVWTCQAAGYVKYGFTAQGHVSLV